MTVDIACPSCGSDYVLDESTAAGEFVCPSCSHTSAIDPAPAERAAGAAAVAPSTGVSVSTESAVAPVAAVAPPPRVEIVCPRCQLHFAPEKHVVEVRPGQRSTILIIEEEGYSRYAATEALAKQYDVVTAGTVDAGHRILALGGIDLMVLDPDVDQGLGRQLLRQGVLKTCPVVIYGHDESELYGEAWEKSLQEGVDDMVIKGMNAAEALVRKVSTLLGHSVDEDEI